MARIARSAEADINYVKRFKERENENKLDVTNAISHATVTSAHDLGAAGMQDMGRVMGAITASHKGRVDGKALAALVRARLGAGAKA
jgi:uncharacterized protein YqeY